MSSLGSKQREQTAARQQAARRRAAVLGILILLLASTLILGVTSTAPIWLAFIAAGLLLGFLIVTAMTANLRKPAAPQRRRAAPAVQEEIVVEEVREVAPVTSSRRRVKSLAEDEEFMQWNAWDEDDGWEAIPQTLPTYVNAPRASSIPRGIDRAHDGEWSGSAMVRAAQQARRPQTQEVIVDHHASTQEIPAVQDRRAAGE